MLPVVVTPKSRANQILPYKPTDVAVRLKVTAPPEEGKANEAVITLLSKHLDLPKRSIGLKSGQSNRQKVLLIKAPDTAMALSKLAAAMEAESQGCFEDLN